MSLIVETGTGDSTSEAYATVLYADAYLASTGDTLWATMQTIEKEQALRRAANFMCQSYRLRWKGCRINSMQALDWPRYNVVVPDLGVFNVIDPAIVPIIIQQANAALALIAGAGDLNPNVTQGVLSKQVGPIKIVYDSMSPRAKRYTAVEDMLRPFFTEVGSANFPLRRT